MPASEIFTRPSRRHARLIDESFERYLAWRKQAAAVADTYCRWGAAPTGGRSAAFAVYCAAVDQEEVTATDYREVAERLGRSVSVT